MKRSVRERTKEEMNKLAKKAKGQVLAKRKTNISDLKKKGNPDQRLTKTWRGSKTEGEVNVNFVSYYLSLV